MKDWVVGWFEKIGEEWIGGWMDGWMNGWMNGWMDG